MGEAAAGRSPDFVCIGAQKAATTWLYQQLNWTPGVFVPGIKELHYFSQVYTAWAQPYAAGHRRRQAEEAVAYWQGQPDSSPYKAGQLAQLRHVLADRPGVVGEGVVPAGGGGPGDAWYRGIFGFAKPEDVCGEICPDYMILSRAGVEHVRRLNAAVRAVLIVRDPVERAWSHMRMSFASQPLEAWTERLRGGAGLEWYVAYSDYAGSLLRWRSVLGAERVLVVAHDAVRESPVAMLNEVAGFIGMRVPGEWPRAGQVVFEGPSAPMPGWMRAELLERLWGQYEFLAGLWPERVAGWLRGHGVGGRTRGRRGWRGAARPARVPTLSAGVPRAVTEFVPPASGLPRVVVHVGQEPFAVERVRAWCAGQGEALRARGVGFVSAEGWGEWLDDATSGREPERVRRVAEHARGLIERAAAGVVSGSAAAGGSGGATVLICHPSLAWWGASALAHLFDGYEARVVLHTVRPDVAAAASLAWRAVHGPVDARWALGPRGCRAALRAHLREEAARLNALALADGLSTGLASVGTAETRRVFVRAMPTTGLAAAMASDVMRELGLVGAVDGLSTLEGPMDGPVDGAELAFQLISVAALGGDAATAGRLWAGVRVGRPAGAAGRPGMPEGWPTQGRAGRGFVRRFEGLMPALRQVYGVEPGARGRGLDESSAGGAAREWRVEGGLGWARADGMLERVRRAGTLSASQWSRLHAWWRERAALGA